MAVPAVRASLESSGIDTAVSFVQEGGGRAFWRLSRENVLCVSAEEKLGKNAIPGLGKGHQRVRLKWQKVILTCLYLFTLGKLTKDHTQCYV
ncbi:hypothetical protein [Microcoleus sp. B9-D4]|uniref:hypothetical protein n=1 Tax=Microcoleus sp. B9-D4 TaxID=2818711 RepID=UPI002FD23404